MHVIRDVPREFLRHGFRRIAVLNWHYENGNFLYESVRAAIEDMSVFQGLSGDEYLDAIAELAQVPDLVGIDLCEVDPEVDGSWRTELLAASSLLSLLGPRIYRQEAIIPAAELQAVFVV